MAVNFEQQEYLLPESTSDGMGGYVPVCLKLKGTTQRPVTVYVSTNNHGGKAIGLIVFQFLVFLFTHSLFCRWIRLFSYL